MDYNDDAPYPAIASLCLPATSTFMRSCGDFSGVFEAVFGYQL
jgi:hypothetical protein